MQSSSALSAGQGVLYVAIAATAWGTGGAAAADRPGFHHAHAAGAHRALDRQRLPVEQETHAFLARVLHFAARAGHVVLAAAIGAGDLGRAQPQRRAYAVHRGVASAQHQHAFSGQIKRRIVAMRPPQLPARIGHQEGQGRQHARQILPRQPAVHLQGISGPGCALPPGLAAPLHLGVSELPRAHGCADFGDQVGRGIHLHRGQTGPRLLFAFSDPGG